MDEPNCEDKNVNFEEVFSDPYKQGFTDGYAERQTETGDELYKEAYEAEYDDGKKLNHVGAARNKPVSSFYHTRILSAYRR